MPASHEFSVSVVIPNWNGEELLKKNIPFVLRALKNDKNSILEIIVVDDGSSDKSLEILAKEFPQITIIKRKVNGGFSKAVNDGVSVSHGNLVCLLNSDVRPEEDFLESTIGLFSDSDLFAVSLHEKSRGPSVGEFVDGFVGYKSGKESSSIANTFWVSGGTGVFRKTVWDKLGGLDDNLYSPFYWEDLDICYRSIKRGYKLLWNPKSLVEHEHESTVKKSRYSSRMKSLITERNQLRFIWKNITSTRLTRKHYVGLVSRILKHPGYVVVVLFAILKLPYIIKGNVVEKRQSKISDESIFASFQ